MLSRGRLHFTFVGGRAGVLSEKVFVRRELISMDKKNLLENKNRISRLCLFYFKLTNAWWIRGKGKRLV